MNRFLAPQIADDEVHNIIASHFDTAARINEGQDDADEVSLLAGQAEFRDRHGHGNAENQSGSEYGDFSTDEESDGGYESDQDFE